MDYIEPYSSRAPYMIAIGWSLMLYKSCAFKSFTRYLSQSKVLKVRLVML